MRHWTFWDWVAYLCLLVGAVILAADTGVRLSPELARLLPEFLRGAYWGFAPLVLMSLATLILVANEFGWLEKLGFYRTPKFFLERDPHTGRMGIQTFPGVTYIQLSVRATKLLQRCKMWVSRVEFRENKYIPFAEANNERHQLKWARPNEFEMDLGPGHPTARATICIYAPEFGLIYEPPFERTPSNLYPLLQRIGIHRFSLIFLGEARRGGAVFARLFFDIDWRGIDGGGAFVSVE